MAPVIERPLKRQLINTHDRGTLYVYERSSGDVPLLHVKGSPEEMGRQYGALVGGRVVELLGTMVAVFASTGMPRPLIEHVLDNAWRRMEPFAPPRYLAEMDAIAAGARDAGHDVSPEDLRRIVAATNFDLYRREERVVEFMDPPFQEEFARMMAPPRMSCAAFAIWGERTAGGKMYSLRNLDWVSQAGIHEGRLVTVYEPDGQRPFVTMGYAGIVGALAGMNDRGITIGEIGAFSASEELDGTPWTLMTRRVLEEAGSLDEAVEVVRETRHTIGMNFVIADGDAERCGTDDFSPGAAAFETNASCCEVFLDDDPKEREAVWTSPDGVDVPYGLPLSQAVLRADMAFGRCCRRLQACDNGAGAPGNDGNPANACTYAEIHKPMHDMIRAYATGDEYTYPVRNQRVIERGAPRSIGAPEALNIAATVAHNVEKLADSDWNVLSVVYAASDLQFYVAFESCDGNGVWKNAPDSGYIQFDLRELLEA